MYYCCGISDKGAVRDNNEDAYLLNRTVFSETQSECDVKAPFIAAVADGVGGEASGEIASRMALKLLSAVRFSKRVDMHTKVMTIHSKLKKYGAVHDASSNMQTTLCALAVDENERAYIVNVGDSRIYRCREGSIRQLSRDQSLVQMLYEQGSIAMHEKKNHAQRNVIFPVLGNIADEPEPCITEIEGGICKGDVIIVCTDGLHDYLTLGEFEEILAMPMHLSKRLRRLVDAAMENGSTDNITVVGISAV